MKKKTARPQNEDMCYTTPTEGWIRDVEDTLERLNIETSEITEEEQDNRAMIGQLIITQSTLIDIVYRLERELNEKMMADSCPRHEYYPLKIVHTPAKVNPKINC